MRVPLEKYLAQKEIACKWIAEALQEAEDEGFLVIEDAVYINGERGTPELDSQDPAQEKE